MDELPVDDGLLDLDEHVSCTDVAMHDSFIIRLLMS